MPVVVIGAGYTGQRVISLLPPGEVTSFRRSGLDLDSPPPHLAALPPAYALLYTVPPSPLAEQDRRLDALLELLEPVPRRIVYLSTTGVYGDHQGSRVNEDTAPAPATDRAKRRLAAERLLLKWCGENESEAVILRIPGIYGPGRLGLNRISNRDAILVEADSIPGNRIHADDLAACCVRALDNAAPPGTYNVGDGDHRSPTAFIRTVARVAGLESPPEVSQAEAERTFDKVRLSFLSESRIVDTNRMREVLGFTPRYTDPEAGIRASL